MLNFYVLNYKNTSWLQNSPLKDAGCNLAIISFPGY